VAINLKQMRTTFFVLAASVAIIATSCKRDPGHGFPIPEVKAAEITSPGAPTIPPAIEKSVREKGQAIAAEAFGVLSSRLGKAIADAGYTNAIEFCSVHGITLTTSVGVTNEVLLRRVTHRPRNPQNRADTNELAIIRQFETELSKGATPIPVVAASKPNSFTYYAPIVLNLPLCVSCHGEPGTDIKPDVLAQIKKTYPADEATGFKLGQLRGLWSVDFKRADFLARP
jgi:hypothetical protein